jgi:hypothetical protein
MREQFARWLFGVRGKVKVEKTELDRDPSTRRCRHLFERLPHSYELPPALAGGTQEAPSQRL